MKTISIKIFAKHKGLLVYTILNYVDKFLNFFTPFLILKLQGVGYTEIEYLISISIIFSSFSDFGMRQYFFYSYKTAENKEKEVFEYHQTTYSIVTLYTVIGFFGLCLKSDILVLYGIFKGIFQTFINLESSISRLQDNPNKVLWLNMTINAGIISIFLIFHYLNLTFRPIEYTIIYIIYCLFFCLRFFKPLPLQYISCENHNYIYHKLSVSLRIFLKSIKFAYPTIIILIINGIETNLSKVYGYDTLSEGSYQYMAVLLRFFSILILAHSSLIGYKSKHIYLSQGGIKRRDILTQITFVSSAFILMVVLIVISNKINLLNQSIQFNNVFVIVSITYSCMICRAFLEPYFAKQNKLKLLILPSAISLITITSLLIGFNQILNNLTILLGIIMIGEILATSLVLITYKLKILKL